MDVVYGPRRVSVSLAGASDGAANVIAVNSQYLMWPEIRNYLHPPNHRPTGATPTMTHLQSPQTGELIETFTYSKWPLVLMYALAGIFFLAAAFLLVLKNHVPVDGYRTIHMGVALVLACGLAVLGLTVWQGTLRKARYEVYERGITEVVGRKRTYIAFAEMQDLYLFGTGKLGAAGFLTDVAYRLAPTTAFHWANQHLGRHLEFMQLVCQLHVRERLPVMITALSSDSVVTFNYVSSAQVWKKRILGKYLDVTTQPILLTRTHIEVGGRRIPAAALAQVDINQWSERITIKDASGAVALSTIASGIFSLDLCLETLAWILRDENRA